MGIPGLFIGPLIIGITYAAYKIYRKEKNGTTITVDVY
jgi:predicted PurR-regulated permease PerM